MDTDTNAARTVAAALATEVVRTTRLAGGMIGDVARVDLVDGRSVVAKTSPRNDLRIEAFMLRTLADRSPLPVPAVMHTSERSLILEHLPGRPGAGGDEEQRHLARLIAATHDVPGPAFGFERDTLLGPFALPNDWTEDGAASFRDRRLRWSLALARTSGALPKSTATRVDTLAARLPELLADHAPRPALLHGDLWSGNVLVDGGRVTGVLDPAIYYGDPETELAFVDLFGGVGDAFWRSYRAERPLPDAFFVWRRHLWQLVPLLVHVALFGRGYVAALEDRLARVEERF